MGKVYIYTKQRKQTFSDTAQYFHSKHLKNLPKRREKALFAKKRCFRAQQICSRFCFELLLNVNLTKLIESICCAKHMLVFIHENMF